METKFKVGNHVLVKGHKEPATITGIETSYKGEASYTVRFDGTNQEQVCSEADLSLAKVEDSKPDSKVESKPDSKFKVGDRVSVKGRSGVAAVTEVLAVPAAVTRYGVRFDDGSPEQTFNESDLTLAPKV